MNNNQKFINENFKRWINEEVEQEEINEELLEEGIILTIQMARAMTNVMQVLIRTEKGRDAIRRIPIAGDQILAAVQQGDKAVQLIQDIAEKIRSDSPLIYKLVWYPFVATAFIFDFIPMAGAKIVNTGAVILKKQQEKAKIEGDANKVAKLEDVEQKREQALEDAEEIKNNVVEPALEENPLDKMKSLKDKFKKNQRDFNRAQAVGQQKANTTAAVKALTKRTKDDADKDINE
tara:strand:- start:954 stop:1655 length:702 start_codon:yes stop_codon:yes gene_type:complete